MVRKLFSCALFCVLAAVLLLRANEILVTKELNRYYILDKELERMDESYDVQVYGSCHAYTTFNPVWLMEEYGVSGYNMSNPSEIIPVSYLRMVERFKKDVPKVALVELWGANAYETYIDLDAIMYDYLRPNIEGVAFSLQKLEFMYDFRSARLVEENLTALKYKDRLIEESLTKLDFDYDYERLVEKDDPQRRQWNYREIDLRVANRGYKPYPTNPIEDYEAQQAKVDPQDKLKPENLMLKYIDKIIDLCDKKGVELIFYRAPYRSNANELRKANYLAEYFAERGVTFFDLEKEIDFDPMNDFYDYEHLSETGARKATDFLNGVIAEYL